MTEQPKTGAEVFKAPPENSHGLYGHSPAASILASLPTDAKLRKNAPMHRGLLAYFPKALAAVAELSQAAMVQHGLTELGWDRTKSTDHGDCIVRHQCEAGAIDTDGRRHSTKVAWRSLAQLEIELENAEAKTR